MPAPAVTEPRYGGCVACPAWGPFLGYEITVQHATRSPEAGVASTARRRYGSIPLSYEWILSTCKALTWEFDKIWANVLRANLVVLRYGYLPR